MRGLEHLKAMESLPPQKKCKTCGGRGWTFVQIGEDELLKDPCVECDIESQKKGGECEHK